MKKIIIFSIIAFLGIAKLSALGIDDYRDIDIYMGSGKNAASPKQMKFDKDGAYYYQLDDKSQAIVKYETRTGKEVETVFDVNRARESKLESIAGFQFSPEGSKILVWRNHQSIYRRSSTAEYFVYEIRSRLLRPLSTDHPRQQSPLFSPDGRMIAFVSDNNIYLKKLDYWTEIAVTTDGEKNKIINGVPDWTYEEEFSTTCSMTWSPENETLCYLKYNESDVPMFSFPLYGGNCNKNPEYELYPGSFSYKYPVAGKPNSIVTLHSYDIDNRKTKNIELPDKKIEYIPRIQFAYSADRLIVAALNRAQTRLELYSVNPKSTIVKSILVEEYKAWLNPATYEDIKFYPDFFVIISSRSGFDHLYRYSYAGSLLSQITSGDFDVTAFYGYDSSREQYFFQSTINGAINKTVSKIDKKGKITDVSPKEGSASASFSPDMAFYTLRYSSTTTPPTYSLYATNSEKEIKVLEANESLKNKFAKEPKREFFTMKSDGVELNGYMVKPADFNPSRKYPVVMYQYSGPGSQQVLNEWNIGWMTYYASRGYIVICVDGRGTGGRGRAFMDVVYKKLGYYESIDQVNAAKYAASLPYVDSNRIGIHGWSYGGYETLMAASQANAPYAAAVAVAPVTDWRFYDTVYAERYMLTPQENEEGYEISAPISYVKNVKCPILIMSGTADDNVHYSNTVEYISAMESAGKWIDLLVFPNMNHSINDCNAQPLVYARMLNYFDKNMR